MLTVLWQSLGETGTVVSEDNDSDVRVDVAGHIWTFNAACCTRLAPPTKPADKKPGSEHSDEQSSDEDSSDNDDDEEDTIGLSRVFMCLLLVCGV